LPNLFFSIPDRFQDHRSPPGYYTLGIDALNPTPTRRLAFAIRPISVRSPCGVRFLIAAARIIVPGPLRLAKLAVPCNLLEPSIECAETVL